MDGMIRYERELAACERRIVQALTTTHGDWPVLDAVLAPPEFVELAAEVHHALKVGGQR